MRKLMIAAALATALLVPAAEATPFYFSYQTASGTLAGQLEGTLQADNNTIVVSSIPDFVSFNGSLGPSLPFVLSAGFGSGLDPVVTLDGSFMDFIACNSSVVCDDGFAFNPGRPGSIILPGIAPFYLAGPSFGNTQENYILENWSITAAAMPLPATLPLFLIGAAALAVGRRRNG